MHADRNENRNLECEVVTRTVLMLRSVTGGPQIAAEKENVLACLQQCRNGMKIIRIIEYIESTRGK
jgi:hypothetical protein